MKTKLYIGLILQCLYENQALHWVDTPMSLWKPSFTMGWYSNVFMETKLYIGFISRTSTMKIFINNFWSLTTFISSILDVWQQKGSEYISGMNLLTNIFSEISKLSSSYCHSITPTFLLGKVNFRSHILKKGHQKKINAWGI